MKTKKYKGKYKVLKALANQGIRIGSFLSMLFMGIAIHAQEASLTVSVSYDTVYLGNVIAVDYRYSNIQCEHEWPGFPESWRARGGPNTSIQTSISNGVTRSEQKYSYILTPQKVGVYELKSVECGNIKSDAVKIYVLENPEDIKQKIPRTGGPDVWMGRGAWDMNPSSPAPDMQERPVEPIKPKRKTYKL